MQLEDIHWKNIKTQEIKSLILQCLGIELQLNAQIPYGVLGENLQISLLVNNPSPLSVSLKDIQLKNKSIDLNENLKTNLPFNKKFETEIDGAISSPYWLTQMASQGMYTTDKKKWIGAAKTPAAYIAKLNLSIEGKTLITSLPLQYRRTDPVKGEVLTSFHILPNASLEFEAPVYLFATGQNRRVKVSVKNLGPSIKGTLSLETPKSWIMTPKSIEVDILGKGIENDFYFHIKAPLETGVGFLKPLLLTKTKTLRSSLQEIAYDHIPKQYLISPSKSRVVALNLKTGVEKVAYIKGAGDNIPQSLSAVGVEVEILKASDITLKKLNPFDAVIIPSISKNNKENLEKAEKILDENTSIKILPILRKIVSTKEGTASLADIDGYEIAGKTGTANKSYKGIYSKEKINTFVSIFPSSKPKYVLMVLLDEPKVNKDYIYNYRDGSGFEYKGNLRNTAGWTTVEIAGKIIERVGPILATKY